MSDDLSDKLVLLCMRAADAPMVAPGSSFDKHCSLCGERVAMAPTSEHLLDKVSIVCKECASTTLPEEYEIAFPAPADQMVKEIGRAIPNPWRKRN